MVAQEPTLVIDCSRCPDRQGEVACEGCIVAYIIDRPEGAVVFDAAEERAIRALRDGGLLPSRRGERRTG